MKRYHAHFTNSVEYDDFTEVTISSLAAAKRHCEENVERDHFRMPRVYVEQCVGNYSDLDAEWDEIGFHELCGGKWLYMEADQ
ncbi:hypothetical protein [uncultured Roseobacter sp.]|uniref:hypothetical protein n=1 Tax=uncultured Roseobacter sp. TaxID=114847 RepID=UPI0026268AF8|nr:hypothetical protein [uncultured Roseobacter sp.]